MYLFLLKIKCTAYTRNFPNFICAYNTSEMTMRPQLDNAMARFQLPTLKWSDTPGPDCFVPGPRGAKRIASQATCLAGWEEKMLIAAATDFLQ